MSQPQLSPFLPQPSAPLRMFVGAPHRHQQRLAPLMLTGPLGPGAYLSFSPSRAAQIAGYCEARTVEVPVTASNLLRLDASVTAQSEGAQQAVRDAELLLQLASSMRRTNPDDSPSGKVPVKPQRMPDIRIGCVADRLVWMADLIQAATLQPPGAAALRRLDAERRARGYLNASGIELLVGQVPSGRPNEGDTHWISIAEQLMPGEWLSPELTRAGHRRLAFHVTPASNLPSITETGLTARRGPRAQRDGAPAPGVHLFAEQTNALDVAHRWAMDQWGGEGPLALLAVDITGQEVQTQSRGLIFSRKPLAVTRVHIASAAAFEVSKPELRESARA